eukprot:1488307-Amphidinium_carterae.1
MDNYTKAVGEFSREVDAGYVETFHSRRAASDAFGLLVPSRIAAVVKPKSGGGVITRLVHDLRRSGVNSRAKCPERVVLPRLMDPMLAALDMCQKVGEEDVIRGL